MIFSPNKSFIVTLHNGSLYRQLIYSKENLEHSQCNFVRLTFVHIDALFEIYKQLRESQLFLIFFPIFNQSWIKKKIINKKGEKERKLVQLNMLLQR